MFFDMELCEIFSLFEYITVVISKITVMLYDVWEVSLLLALARQGLDAGYLKALSAVALLLCVQAVTLFFMCNGMMGTFIIIIYAGAVIILFLICLFVFEQPTQTKITSNW